MMTLEYTSFHVCEVSDAQQKLPTDRLIMVKPNKINSSYVWFTQ